MDEYPGIWWKLFPEEWRRRQEHTARQSYLSTMLEAAQREEALKKRMEPVSEMSAIAEALGGGAQTLESSPFRAAFERAYGRRYDRPPATLPTNEWGPPVNVGGGITEQQNYTLPDTGTPWNREWLEKEFAARGQADADTRHAAQIAESWSPGYRQGQVKEAETAGTVRGEAAGYGMSPLSLLDKYFGQQEKLAGIRAQGAGADEVATNLANIMRGGRESAGLMATQTMMGLGDIDDIIKTGDVNKMYQKERELSNLSYYIASMRGIAGTGLPTGNDVQRQQLNQAFDTSILNIRAALQRLYEARMALHKKSEELRNVPVQEFYPAP